MASNIKESFQQWHEATENNPDGWNEYVREYFPDDSFFTLECAKNCHGYMPEEACSSLKKAQFYFVEVILSIGRFVMRTVENDTRCLLHECSRILGVPEKLVLDVIQDMILYAANFG